MLDETETRWYRPGEKKEAGGSPAQLLVVEGAARGAVIDLADAEVKIGRRPDNDLVLASPVVSKYHARVVRDGGGFAIEDMGSANGIVINGLRVQAGHPRRLSHGDSIAVGDHLLLFRQSGSFTDKKTGMSTISFDVSKVREEVEALFKDLPLPPRRPG